MSKEYDQVVVGETLCRDLKRLVRLGLEEDLAGGPDWTTVSTVPAQTEGTCEIRARVAGIAAGLVTVPWILEEVSSQLSFTPMLSDGQPFVSGQSLGIVAGNARELLKAERLVLNVVSRLCGVATLTAKFAEKIAGTGARLYDTRKTTVGWRILEKYAVTCGGGHNHRRGLYDGFLIKDNHLALGGDGTSGLAGALAVARAKAMLGTVIDDHMAPQIVEIEIDNLRQLPDVLDAEPDIVLLDNFPLEDLSAAVQLRNERRASIELEASGGVTLDTIFKIAMTGVDRISCGAITHQATWLDLGLDWIG